MISACVVIPTTDCPEERSESVALYPKFVQQIQNVEHVRQSVEEVFVAVLKHVEFETVQSFSVDKYWNKL
jgi:hypothetical protein